MMKAGRTLLASAVAALVIASNQVPGSEHHLSHKPGVIFSAAKMDMFWSYTQNICPIRVCMKVGHFVQVQWSDPDDPNTILVEPKVETRDLERRQIVLRQVGCRDIRKDSEKDWPCYLGCEKLSIRANFDVKLGTRLVKMSDVIDQWEAYLGTDVIVGSGQWQTVKVCVKAWKAKLHEAMGPQQLQVGTLTITVKPPV